MKKQKKQSLLNGIIVILVIVLIMMVGSIVYEEKINMSKQTTQNTSAPTVNEDIIDENKEESDNTSIVEGELESDVENEELPVEDKEEEEYVGEEENTTVEEPEMSIDEKVIDLVKKEWGKDTFATFNIEKKNGNKYRVAVRDNSTTVLAWYEVDIETWEVSEY